MLTSSSPSTTADPFAQATRYLARVLPWPNAGEPPAFVDIMYTVPGKDGSIKKPYWRGRAVTSLDEAINALGWISRQPETIGIYACLSTQREATQKTDLNGSPYYWAIRNQLNAAVLKSLFIDIDTNVTKQNEKGYEDISTAMKALAAFVKATGLPPPNVVVGSGGGMHVYWVMSRALPPDEWKSLAFALAEAIKRHGLKCDPQCTIDSARVMRIPDTLNRKVDPPLPVKLLSNREGDYSVERIAKSLEPYTARLPARVTPASFLEDPALFPQRPPVNDNELGAGVDISKKPPIDLDLVAKECAFIRDAIATGGATYSNPLWNLTTLVATFTEGGRTDAHRMGNKHPGYSVSDTDALFDRKEREKAQKGLGWPSCRTLSASGCKACHACPHFAANKSPLNFANVGLPSKVTSVVDGKSLTAGLDVTFVNIPHRKILYGIDVYVGEITMLAAPGGSAKTSLAIGICVCLVTNKAVLEEKIWIFEPKVLYINGEDSATEIRRRIWAFCLKHGFLESQLKNFRLLAADDYRTQKLSFLRSERGASVLDGEALEFLRTLLDAVRPNVVVLDPFISFCSGGNPNDNAAMASVMRALKQLAADFQCAFVILHHTRKGGDPGHAESISGASSIVNLSRRAIMNVPMTDKEAAKYGVPPTERSFYFKTVSAKSNLAPPSDDCPWYKLENVTLPNPEPPAYSKGDNVQAVVRVQLSGLRSASDPDDQKIKKAILDLVHGGKLIDGQTVPYSTNGTGSNNVRAIFEDAMRAVAAATQPREWHEADLRAAVDRTMNGMKKDGWLVQQEIQKGRFRRGSGLSVNWDQTPWSGTDVETNRHGGQESDGQLVNGVVND